MQKWKVNALDIVDGFDRHLSASAPRSARNAFDIFRQQIRRAKRRQEMKGINERLETLLQSRPFFRGAGHRFIQEQMKKVISNCEDSCRGFETLRKRHPDVFRRSAHQIPAVNSSGRKHGAKN
jgi:hypothetical protein